jgi:hypothetical protein
VSGCKLLSRAFFSATSTMVEACASVMTDMVTPICVLRDFYRLPRFAQ